jgi:release factor glutamine methyltransferase
MESTPSGDQVRRYRRATALYADGAPFQSAVGLAEFRNLRLTVTPDVLIPRVETEELVTHVLDWARQNNGPWGVAADVGTGSGAIALALATEGNFERIIATDISPAALDVARSNIGSVHPRTPVELRLGNLLDPLVDPVDVLVSNPPYLTSAECERLDPEVRDFEPRLALDGGEDGLDPYRVVIGNASSRLVPGGLLALEIDSRRPEMIESMAGAAGWLNIRLINDVFGRARYLLAKRGKTAP